MAGRTNRWHRSSLGSLGRLLPFLPSMYFSHRLRCCLGVIRRLARSGPRSSRGGDRRGRTSGFQTWQPVTFANNGSVARLVSSGIPMISKNSSFESLAADSADHLPSLKHPKRCGGEAGQPFAERKLAVHPGKSLSGLSGRPARSKRSHPAPGHKVQHTRSRSPPAAEDGRPQLQPTSVSTASSQVRGTVVSAAASPGQTDDE